MLTPEGKPIMKAKVIIRPPKKIQTPSPTPPPPPKKIKTPTPPPPPPKVTVKPA